MMNQDELNKILADHKVWLRGDGGKRANLSDADLWGADLWGANLSDADLWGADLWGANLSDADLRGANLWGANLWGADLSRADLRGADLSRADLRGANLSDADLSRADLSRADLRGADLSRANLDYSCLPLWCGSKGVIVDKRIAAQIAAHFCALTCDDPDYQAARSAILEFAKTSHRAGELGLSQQTPIISDKYSEIEHLQARIAELEQERDYLDGVCAAFENDFVLLDVTEKLKKAEARIVELEAKLDLHKTNRRLLNRDLGFAHERIAELEIQLKSKDIIINNQQGRLNYYATKDLLGGKNE